MPTDAFLPNQLIAGRYRLGKLLGRGGMALVYQASDQNLEREVAVKFIRPELISDIATRRRFSREAQSAGGLNHPNIVAVYDTGSFSPEGKDSELDVPYIVMELVEGQTLQELMIERRIAAGLSPSPDQEKPTRPAAASTDTDDDKPTSPKNKESDNPEEPTSPSTAPGQSDTPSASPAYITDTLDDLNRSAELSTGAAQKDDKDNSSSTTEATDSDGSEDDESVEKDSRAKSAGTEDATSEAKPDLEHKPTKAPSAAMPVAEAVDIATEVLSALAYSHERGIVHRDIKPGNIMVNERGDIKVMDFGIARAMSDAAATQTQHPVGTAHYISPEQAQAQPVDHRSDIYSAACLFYELLTGSPPFRGDTPVAITYQHVEKEPTLPSEVLPDVPPALDAVIAQAMAKSAENRYQSADDFLRELEQACAADADKTGNNDSAEDNSTKQQPDVIVLRADVDAQPAPETGAGTDTAEITETTPRKRHLVFAGLGLAALAVMAMLVLAFTHLISDSRSEKEPLKVATPQVLQLDKALAQEKIESLGLIFREVEKEPSDTPEGTVLNTSPIPGVQVKRGTVIMVVVSSGPEKARIPSVLGYAKDAARTTLIDAGFVIEKIEQVDDPDAPAGSVVSVEPEMGSTQPTGTKVTVRVCSGYITLPDVSGKTLAEAQSTLKNMKLETLISEEATWSQAPGTIIRHTPAAGRIRQQSTVGLVVAKRPAPRPEKPTPTPTRTSEAPKKTPTATPSKSKPPANRVTPTSPAKTPTKPAKPTQTLD